MSEQSAYIRLFQLHEKVVCPSVKAKLELGSKFHSPLPASKILDP